MTGLGKDRLCTAGLPYAVYSYYAFFHSLLVNLQNLL